MTVDGLHSGVVGFRDMRMAVSSTLAAPLQWLEEFFGPYAAPAPGVAATHEICLRIDPERHDALRGAGHRGERRIDGFALDGDFAELTFLADAPDARLLHDERSDAFVMIGADGRDVQIVARADHGRVRVLLMRVVRELAMLASLERGDVLVHAAAAVHGGRAVLIAGQKRAGKTTMLVSLLSTRGAQYLSNDRVLVNLSSSPPMAYGLPTIARVRADALDHLPRLRSPPRGRYYLTAREFDQGSSLIRPTTRPDHSMSPSQLCRWLDVEAAPAAPVGLVVFVRVDPSVERFALRRLDHAEATDHLRDSLFSSGPAGCRSEAFGRGRHNKAGLDDPRQRLQSHDLVACECRVGPQAFHQPDLSEAIFATATSHDS